MLIVRTIVLSFFASIFFNKQLGENFVFLVDLFDLSAVYTRQGVEEQNVASCFIIFILHGEDEIFLGKGVQRAHPKCMAGFKITNNLSRTSTDFILSCSVIVELVGSGFVC